MIPKDVTIRTEILGPGEIPVMEDDGLKGKYINRKTKRVVCWENRVFVPMFEIFRKIPRHKIDPVYFDKSSKTRLYCQYEYDDCVDLIRKNDSIVNRVCVEIESKIFGYCGKLASLGSSDISIVYRMPMTILFSDISPDASPVAAFVHVGFYSLDK